MYETDQNDQNQAGPATLEDALYLVRSGNQPNAGSAMGADGMGESAGAQEPQGDDTQGQHQETDLQGGGGLDGAEGRSYDGGDGDGGSPAASEELEGDGEVGQPYDYNGIGQAYVQSAQQMAIRAANKTFKDNGISKVSINDLYERDESGRVSFSNPDDPDHPFQSRAEAQQWCDAFNSQVDNEWRNTVMQYQQQFAKDIQPTLRTIDFAPEYDSMTPKQQEVFDEITDGYRIKDRSGTVIGYSCDLRAAKRMAENICASFEDQAPQGQAASTAHINGAGPALDANTSGTGNPQNEKREPKNMAEAMKMIADHRKKERQQ